MTSRPESQGSGVLNECFTCVIFHCKGGGECGGLVLISISGAPLSYSRLDVVFVNYDPILKGKGTYSHALLVAICSLCELCCAPRVLRSIRSRRSYHPHKIKTIRWTHSTEAKRGLFSRAVWTPAPSGDDLRLRWLSLVVPIIIIKSRGNQAIL